MNRFFTIFLHSTSSFSKLEQSKKIKDSTNKQKKNNKIKITYKIISIIEANCIETLRKVGTDQ
ncbi:hypothetical protein B0A71_10775 [Flavobacterium tructae]|uniref:Uncharacterized protein n=1 Tax=Flavobacterium tructae TaxID=1114873 RepID=A0A1S1JCF3_9FLAO|nr:hypothetical protein BHE19_21145 [Flavobacterium tructae]OXB19906.1 hypothetical protein B0A71_10775 [Flavobacterium tructae]